MLVLLIVATGSILLHSIYLKQERLNLIDQQIRETASALIESQLGDPRKINFEEADAIISEELGESRIGKFFIMRNQAGDIIYESVSARLLPITEFPRAPQWIQMSLKGKMIRMLNLQLPRVPDRTLQVGLVLDEDLISASYFSSSSLTFLALAFVLGLGVTLISTSFLLRPITELENFLTGATAQSKMQTYLPLVPAELSKPSLASTHDEFARMIHGLNKLIEKVNKNYQFSRLWAYQMAHELKTPLSIISLEIEKVQKNHNLNSETLLPINLEITKVSETINSFLGWAELENLSQQQSLFANKLGDSVAQICARLLRDHTNYSLNLQANPFVAATPQHLEQLISNLISNAIIYSPASAPLEIKVTENSFIIKDHGYGISQDVLDRMGEPFNRAEQKNSRGTKGHGLGLAWVKSICRLYDWKISFTQHPIGTEICVSFPVS